MTREGAKIFNFKILSSQAFNWKRGVLAEDNIREVSWSMANSFSSNLEWIFKVFVTAFALFGIYESYFLAKSF